mmetsp:Transcript_17542/g.33379  ORF Transcript_17542/g.33379 Transcript_17542/m.33379 type:complete len:305 (-) Transcript_17542:176-1090(-)
MIIILMIMMANFIYFSLDSGALGAVHIRVLVPVPVDPVQAGVVVHGLHVGVPRVHQVLVRDPGPHEEVALYKGGVRLRVAHPIGRRGHRPKVLVQPRPQPGQRLVLHQVNEVVPLLRVCLDVEDVAVGLEHRVAQRAALGAEPLVGPPAQLGLAVHQLERAQAQRRLQRVRARVGGGHHDVVHHLRAVAGRLAAVLPGRDQRVPVADPVDLPEDARVGHPQRALHQGGQPVHGVDHAVVGGTSRGLWEERRVHEGVHPEPALEQGVLLPAERVVVAAIVGAAAVVAGHNDDCVVIYASILQVLH